MCNLKRFALANLAIGFGLAAFGCASPIEEASSTTAAATAEPGAESEQAEPTERAGVPGRVRARPSLRRLPGARQGEQRVPGRPGDTIFGNIPRGRVGAIGPEGVPGLERTLGPGGPFVPMGPEAAFQMTEHARQLAERMADDVRAGVQRHLALVAGMREMMGAGLPQGLEGFEGLQGPQGIEGLQGPQGIEGLQGPQGIEGPQGFEGPQGPQGIEGPQQREGRPRQRGVRQPSGREQEQEQQGEPREGTD